VTTAGTFAAIASSNVTGIPSDLELSTNTSNALM
jgi:hypothetical protein